MPRIKNIFLLLTAIAMMLGVLGPIGLSFLAFGASGYNRVIGMVWLFVPFGLAGYACASARERGLAPAWMMAGMVAAIAAFFSWLPSLWLPYASVTAQTEFYIAPPVTAFAGLLMLCAMLLHLRASRPWVRTVRRITVAMIALLAVWIVGAVWFYSIAPLMVEAGFAGGRSYRVTQHYVEGAVRYGSIIAILAGCGMLTTFIGAALPGLHDPSALDRDRLPFSLICPRCGATGTWRTEGDHCPKCGLMVKVSVL